MAKNDVITVFEHQSLTTRGDNRFTEDHLELLERFRGNKEDEKFPYYSLINHGVKFKHYVGVLCVGNLQIEVLPKTDNNTDDENTWRPRLLHMLTTVYRLQAHAPSHANQKLKHSPVLDVFLQRFLDEVERLLHIGLIKTYRKETDNRNALKGKIVWNKHVTKNVVHKERFYVTYTTYDRNHVMNRIIYKTLKMIPEVTSNSYVANRAKTLAFEFPELLDIHVTETTFATIRFDRKSEGYHDVMQIAKLILLNYMPDQVHHRNNVLALMFDMNRLWEEYVYVILKRELKGVDVSAQQSKSFWKHKTIRPDIVVSPQKDGKPIVIDTKWKLPKDNMPSDGDLKQMYAYHKYWNADHTILLYPGTDSSKDNEGKYHNEVSGIDATLTCHLVFVPFNKNDNSLNYVSLLHIICSTTPIQQCHQCLKLIKNQRDF